MPKEKSNHNRKEMLECVPGLLLKRYHKTLKLAQKYSTQHIFNQSKSNRHLRHLTITSNIDMVHNNMHVHKIPKKTSNREHTWIACMIHKIPPKMLEWLGQV